MAFRPSVLPDRDNDIISTFTRSFERARQLVRQDQADVRERKQSEQLGRLREQQIEDLEFQAGVRRGAPGVFRRGETEPIAEALGGGVGVQVEQDAAGRVGEVAGTGGVGVQVEPGRRDQLPAAAIDATDVGGGFAFSRRLQQEIEAGELRTRQEAAEVTPEATRERETAETEQRELTAALSEFEDITPASRRALLRDPEAARRVIRERTEPPTGTTDRVTGAERREADIVAAINQRAADMNIELAPGEALILSRNQSQLRDFFAEIPTGELRLRQDRLDDVRRQIRDLEDPDNLMGPQARQSAKTRALIDAGYLQPGQPFTEGLEALNREEQTLLRAAGGRSRESRRGREPDVVGFAFADELDFWVENVASLPTRSDKEASLREDGLSEEEIQQVLSATPQ